MIASSIGWGSTFSPLESTMVSLALPVMIMSPVAGLIRPRSPVSLTRSRREGREG